MAADPAPAADRGLANPDPPQVLFGDLFVAIQEQAVYPDSKAFADATPDESPAQIRAEYSRARPSTPETLRQFADKHFSLPQTAITPLSLPEHDTVGAHIDRLWDPLTRKTPTASPYSSLLPLPRPYVVPGGRFREMYYWDSYFTMLGLDESGRQDLIADMVADFAYLHCLSTRRCAPRRVHSQSLLGR
jgi:alpha,alpha-trehalase